MRRIPPSIRWRQNRKNQRCLWLIRDCDTMTSDNEVTTSAGNETETAFYKYCDFSRVPGSFFVEELSSTQSKEKLTARSSIVLQKFPLKLHAILSRKEFEHIISWIPHGRSWKILKPDLFEKSVMPYYFDNSNYHSFNRLVNAWSFRRISSGPDRGSYYHELFLRGKPHLHKLMRRLPKTHKKLPIKKEDEPNFHELSKLYPLPEVEEDGSSVMGAASLQLQGICSTVQPERNPGSDIVCPLNNTPAAAAQEKGSSPIMSSCQQTEQVLPLTILSSQSAHTTEQALHVEYQRLRYLHQTHINPQQTGSALSGVDSDVSERFQSLVDPSPLTDEHSTKPLLDQLFDLQKKCKELSETSALMLTKEPT